jgi:NAD/NADP transhydrogenase beta subunit
LYVNYLLFAACLTSYIVFLLALNNLPQAQIARQRAICTIIGGGLALLTRLIVLARRKKEAELENQEEISATNISGARVDGTGVSGTGINEPG